MAVGGTTQTTKEKNYALLSPLVNVSENTCLSFETYVLWEKNKKPYDLTLQIYSTLEGGHPVQFLRVCLLFLTGRNEVVAKVIFLHLSVILFTGGGICLSACWDTIPRSRHTPGSRQHPPSYWNAFLFF